jgi:molybdopterin adenylyltransferase
MNNIEILSVNTSEEKGTIKSPVPFIELSELGISGDAHRGNWHRQVSLLGIESVKKAESALGRAVNYGEFAENITTVGFPLYEMKPFDRLVSGKVILEITQIGKECHGEKCAIYRETGECVMPKEGIFARVIHPGTLKAGDILEYYQKVMKVNIITISDRASQGIYEDRSGPLLKKLLQEYFTGTNRNMNVEITIVPDEAESLRTLILKMIAEKADIIFTNGSTGIGPRDIAPEVIRPMLDKEIPGLMEMIRVKYGMQSPTALLSRGLAGVIGKTLIYAMPGSPRAVKEYCDEILKTIEHSLGMLNSLGH